jgi:glycosyltransferase involved in cell wall biosynthesis
MEFRYSGALISHFGKSIASPQIQVLPIQNKYETPNRSESKKKLGFDPNQRIVGTLTNFSKAQAYNGLPSLVDVFLKLSAKYPNCTFLIIGLNEKDFKTIAGKDIQLPNNIHCLGIIVNPESYYESLDLFLEPFPVGSGLGVIEACKHGAIPVFAPQQARLCSTFDVFHIEIQKLLIEATTLDTFYQTIESYFNYNSTEINLLSEKIRDGIFKYHRGENWAWNLDDNAFPFEASHSIEADLLLKNEALFFQKYQNKSTAELIEHLISLKQLITKKLLVSLFIGRNRVFSIFDLNKQNVKRIIIKFLKS